MQHAVRVVEASKRNVQRGFDAQFGNDADRARAKFELTLTKPDIGNIFEWMQRKHSVGRFSCTACSVDMQDTGNPFGPARIGLVRACAECGHGIQHAGRILADAEDAVTAALGDTDGPEAPPRLEIAHGAIICDVGGVYLMHLCDSCGAYHWQKDEKAGGSVGLE